MDVNKNNRRFLGYGLVDPRTNVVRYVGITTRSLRARFAGHVSDVNNRPDLNKHKTAWFLELRKLGLIPRIELLQECKDLEELKQFEIDYVAKYKEGNKLINQTLGGDHVGFRMFSRESILKRSTTKAVVQYNVLGEKIAEYDIIEDAIRELGLGEKAGSHITRCCKHKRQIAYNYIWRYKDDELGDISNISPLSLKCCKLIQYNDDWEKVAEYSSYTEAARAIGVKSDANISNCIAGKQNSVKGFYFRAEPLYAYFDQELFNSKIKEYYTSNSRKNYKNKITTTLRIEVYKNGELCTICNSYSEASEFIIGTINGRKYIKECCDGLRPHYHNYTFKIKNS